MTRFSFKIPYAISRACERKIRGGNKYAPRTALVIGGEKGGRLIGTDGYIMVECEIGADDPNGIPFTLIDMSGVKLRKTGQAQVEAVIPKASEPDYIKVDGSYTSIEDGRTFPPADIMWKPYTNERQVENNNVSFTVSIQKLEAMVSAIKGSCENADSLTFFVSKSGVGGRIAVLTSDAECNSVGSAFMSQVNRANRQMTHGLACVLLASRAADVIKGIRDAVRARIVKESI